MKNERALALVMLFWLCVVVLAAFAVAVCWTLVVRIVPKMAMWSAGA